MPILNSLSIRLQNHPKRVIFTEGADLRIIKAARQFATRKLGAPILIGDKEEIKLIAADNEIRLDGIALIDPKAYSDTPELAKALNSIRRFNKKISDAPAEDFLKNPIAFASMMLLTNRADAMLSGVSTSASSTLRPIMQLIPMQKGLKNISSMVILDTNNPAIGISGSLFMTDCGVIPEPTGEQLCDIAYTTSVLAKHLSSNTIKVAFLSHTSKALNTKLPSVNKMKLATSLLHDKVQRENLDFEVDGEMQIDVALNPQFAEYKGVQSSVAGSANVLIFPELNSGTMAIRLAMLTNPNMHYYGHILTGLQKPVAEIPRIATVEDIYGTAVIVAAQAVDRKYLFPEA
ncbi:MAG: phosphate acyltransferase [Opitutales bacterium]